MSNETPAQPRMWACAGYNCNARIEGGRAELGVHLREEHSDVHGMLFITNDGQGAIISQGEAAAGEAREQ